MKRVETFTEFWPFYLGEHSKPATRLMHFIGSTGVLLNIAAAIVLSQPWYFAGAPLCGYGFAWVSHFFIEKNKPATFTYPLWSLIADWKMWGLTLVGKLGPELQAAGVVPLQQKVTN